LENGTYSVRTIYEGVFDAIPDGSNATIEIPYTDTNLEGSNVFFGELFSGKTVAYIAVPGVGRTADYAGIDVKGKIALVLRGEITYVEKIHTATAAGAAGVIIYNHSPGALGMTLSSDAIAISISHADGLALAASGKGTISFRKEQLPSKEKKTWQMVIDEVNASGAFFVPAHPGDATYPFEEIYAIRNFAGLEVWNGANPFGEGNVRAFQQWDNHNTGGAGKYFGMANSDAHSPTAIANAYNMARMNELSITNIDNQLKNGEFFGTNGPQLRFDIAGITQGKTLKINGDRQNVPVNIRAFDPLHPLTEVILYKLRITGEPSGSKQIIQRWDLTGKNIRHWSVNLNIEVNAGDFYRVEVNSEKSTSSNGAAKGFAFSNPVWIEKTDAASNRIDLINMTLNNPDAKLIQTQAGNYYVLCNNPNNLNANQLIISAAQGVRIDKAYDAENRSFQITVTSPDGTNRHTMQIFVIPDEPELSVSIHFDDRLYDVGDLLQATVTIHNTGSAEVKNITVEGILPHLLTGSGKNQQIIPSLAAGKSESMTFSGSAIEAGRGKIRTSVTAGGFSALKSLDISIAGAGWYGGDAHIHTDLSDGSGTVRQSVATSYAKGMSFLYITDHNDSRSHIDAESITAGSRGDFIAITGIEVDDLEGHGNCYQIPYNIPGGSYLFFTYPVYEGFVEIIPKDNTIKPIRLPYRDTNLDTHYVYFAEVFGDKEYELVWVPGYGRSEDFAGWDLSGKIALISRGVNEFVTKIANAMKAGAVAAVIYDARTGVFNMPLSEGLYGVSITKSDGERLTRLTDSGGGTIGTIKFNPAGLPPKPPQRGRKTWQDMIDETIAGGGFFIPVHPGDPTYPFLNIYTIRNHTGLEIWNGANGLNAGNLLARKYWDDLNTRGEYKYIGISNTDAHNADGVANTYNMCYMDSLTVDNINHALKTGASYGTNGPQLRFDIGGISLGGTLNITGDKQNARVNIRAFDDLHPLTKVDLYRLKVTGQAENTRETIRSWDLTGQQVFNWATDFELEVSDGEFYRIEIHSAKAAAGAATGFACSNPIWIENGNIY